MGLFVSIFCVLASGQRRSPASEVVFVFIPFCVLLGLRGATLF